MRTTARLALPLVSTLCLHGLALPQDSSGPPVQEVRACLKRARSEGLEDVAVLRERLVALGVAALPEMLRALDAGPSEPARLTELEARTLFEAVLAFGRRPVVAAVQTVVDADATSGLRSVALRALGEVAAAEDLPVFIAVVELGEERLDEHGELARELQRATRATLARAVLPPVDLGAWIAQAEGSVGRCMTRGLDGLEPLRRIEVHAELLGLEVRDSVATALLLDRLCAALTVHGPAEVPHLSERVLACLHRGDTTSWELAVRALGLLEERDAVEELIGLLDGAEPRPTATLALALRRITGQRFSGDSLLWRRWHQDEVRWFEETGRPALSRIRSAERLEAFADVADFVRHPLYRHELTEGLLPLLWQAEPAVQEAVCAALGQLGSRAAILELIAVLEAHRTQPLGDFAWRALKSITKRELPPDPEVWKAAYEA